jgi:hypothetical protein
MSWHFTNDSTKHFQYDSLFGSKSILLAIYTNTFLTRKKSSTTFALESHEFYEPSDCDLIYLENIASVKQLSESFDNLHDNANLK